MIDRKPFINWRVVSSIGSEVTPFVFKDRLYRIENFKRCEDFPGQPVQYRFHEDGFRIRDVDSDRIVSVPLLNHYFATAFVWDNRNYGEDLPWWHIRQIVHITSDDLITWSRPELVVQAEGDEHLFNNSVCWDGNRFIMLCETDDDRWPKFTFKYYESCDLSNWKIVPNAVYGIDKYVGGPALCFEAPWYYTLYLHAMENGAGDNIRYTWETRITRSKDLIHWEDAPEDRPFVTFDPNRQTNPDHFPGVYETNASDIDLCEWQDKTLVYWNGGDQCTCGDLQMAEFPGSRKELMEWFFRR